MMDNTQLDDLLDDWEIAISTSPSISAEEFLSCAEAPIDQDLRERFLAQAEALRKIHQRMDMMESPPQQIRLAVNPAPDVEIVPGYRLISRLGVGGFGEVWEAVGPGDVPVALKLVHCDSKTRETERRSLGVMKNVRHANLLAIFGFWETEDGLIIATELADKSLADRLEEVQLQGNVGIPTAELHEYMQEAAKGIDELNRPKYGHRKGIQHRDIKPQNLLLTSGSVKVGDFGLARAITNEVTGHTGSMTIAYAAPECIKGETSQASDQYSLAITYCQLRGGRLPFSGSLAEFYEGHLNGTADLSMLPESERVAVAKALSKDPAHRWASCREFVAAVIDPDSGNSGYQAGTGNSPTGGTTTTFSDLFEWLKRYRFQIGLVMLPILLTIFSIVFSLLGSGNSVKHVDPDSHVSLPGEQGENEGSTPPGTPPGLNTEPASDKGPSVLGKAVERAKASWESSWDWVKTKMK